MTRALGDRGGSVAGASSGLGPAPADEDAASEAPSAREAVDPGDGVRPAPARRAERGDERRRGRERARSSVTIQGDGIAAVELDLEDVAGEPHAAERGAEELRLALVGPISSIAPVGDAQPQRAHVRAEAAGDVVVLAVHVGGDHAAER